MLLLDTNALLWLTGGSERLGARARASIKTAINQNECAFSAISIWEIAMLVRKGRYTLGQTVDGWRADLIAVGLMEIPLDGSIAAMGGSMNLHEDPADRFIAATALQRGATLCTSDQRLIAWANSPNGPGALDATQ